MTFVDSRKYENLKSNFHVSLVIGFEYVTVQYEGLANELVGHEINEALHAFSVRNPCSLDYLLQPKARFFKSSQNGYAIRTINYSG